MLGNIHCNFTDVSFIDELREQIENGTLTGVSSSGSHAVIHYDTKNETPQTKEVERDGEGLPPIGVECEFMCEGFWGDDHYHWCIFLGLLSDGSYAIEFHHPTSPDHVTCGCFDPQCTKFRKPETEEQRKEREELEAAYDLYCVAFGDCGHLCDSYDNFCKEDAHKFSRNAYIAIVRKTGYRVEK